MNDLHPQLLYIRSDSINIPFRGLNRPTRSHLPPRSLRRKGHGRSCQRRHPNTPTSLRILFKNSRVHLLQRIHRCTQSLMNRMNLIKFCFKHFQATFASRWKIKSTKPWMSILKTKTQHSHSCRKQKFLSCMLKASGACPGMVS